MKNTDISLVKPLSNGLIVKRDEQQHTSAAGIFLPGSAQDAPQWAVVIKAGPGKMTSEGQVIPMTVAENDKVLYGQYAGTKFKFNDVEYIFLREDDVLGVLKAS